MEGLAHLSLNLPLFQVKVPRTNNPINLQPLPPLHTFPDLPPNILNILQIPQPIPTTPNLHSKPPSWPWSTLLSCQTCTPISQQKQTQITTSPSSKSSPKTPNYPQPQPQPQPQPYSQQTSRITTTTITTNMNMNTKIKYKQIFMESVRGDRKSKLRIFEELYRDFGNSAEDKWRLAIANSNKKN